MLPIEPELPRIVAAVQAHPVVVLQAPPGSGKTTQVPLALLRAGLSRVMVLEPRRVAARWAARYVAAGLGQEVGQQVGYQVRFDDRTGPDTGLVFATQGILLRQLASHPTLPGVAVVVLDEFHERTLDGDVALAWLRGLAHLRLVIMSATLQAQELAQRLGGPVIDCPGIAHPVDTDYLPGEGPLEDRVAQAISRAASEGGTLVFLPGAAEIRRCQGRLSGFTVLPLHGDLSPAEQDRALEPGAGRKIILSTNIAESSLTVAGVDLVIDSGLARVPRHSPWSGLPRLEVERVSRASADQRAGRAGRTGPGRCLRLYSEADYLARPAQTTPEIAREDLSGLALMLAAAGHPRLAWLDSPPGPSMDAAMRLLERLGAIRDGRLTDLGRAMARLPLEPRLARLVVDCPNPGATLAAMLSERGGAGDVLARLGEKQLATVEQARRQLARIVGPSHAQDPRPALLAAFSDRVARCRRAAGGELELLLCTGGTARVTGDAPVGGLVVALDVEEREQLSTRGRRTQRVLRMWCEVEPEWLLDLPGLAEARDLVWNPEAERVELRRRLSYGELVLEESRSVASPGEDAGRLLYAQASRREWPELDNLEALAARLALAFPEEKLPDKSQVLQELCRTRVSFDQLRQASLREAWHLAADVERRLDRLAPTELDLPGRRRVKVHYPLGQAPWMESRLADFFGLDAGPRVAGGKVAVVLHLLAPNHRPVQVTADLAGFWERTYPKVRSELARRYPRHPWPQDPRVPLPGWKPQRRA